MRPEFFYFDLGNVLVHFDHQIAIRNIAKIAGSNEESVRRSIFDSGLEDRYETGLISSSEFVSQLGESLGAELDEPLVLESASAIFWENAPIVQVLDRLQQMEIPLGILSNTCDAHWSYIERQRYDCVHGRFEKLVLSFRVRSMKPSPGIYEEATRIAGVAPESIFFVDDREENVLGARKAGWRAEVYKDVDALKGIVDGWS